MFNMRRICARVGCWPIFAIHAVSGLYFRFMALQVEFARTTQAEVAVPADAASEIALDSPARTAAATMTATIRISRNAARGRRRAATAKGPVAARRTNSPQLRSVPRA